MRANEARLLGSTAVSQHPRFTRNAHCGGVFRVNPSAWICFVSDMASLAAGAFFLCLCKERSKESTPPAVRPPLRGGCAVPAGIFGRGILPRPKTAHVLCAALRVLPAVTAGPQGPRERHLPDLRSLCCCSRFRIPMRHGEWAGYNPKGAVMDDGASVWHMDVPYGNSRTARGPCAQRRACRLGCVSLILSLHKQRKNALRGERHHV